MRGWDFLFYASFGVVVTSSVRIAGVLLVFSYLIVPALAGILLARRIGARLAVGWAFGAGVSVIAMVASAVLDLPTGATVVCAFGAEPPGPGPGPARPAAGMTRPHRSRSRWSCSRWPAAPPAAPPAKPLVVATIYPLWEFARQVAGDRAEVVVPGARPASSRTTGSRRRAT